MAELRHERDSNLGPLVLSAIAPITVIVLFAVRGWLNVDHAVMVGGLAVVTFAPTYVFADFLLSFFGRDRS
jgi:hypothetical protein